MTLLHTQDNVMYYYTGQYYKLLHRTIFYTITQAMLDTILLQQAILHRSMFCTITYTGQYYILLHRTMLHAITQDNIELLNRTILLTITLLLYIISYCIGQYTITWDNITIYTGH